MKKYPSSYEKLIDQLNKENRVRQLSEKDSFKFFESINENLKKFEKEENYKNNNIKILTSEETNDLIQGIENGDIIIYPRERTPEENKAIGEAIRKHREDYKKTTPFFKRLKTSWHLKYLCYKFRLQDSKFYNNLKKIF